MIQLPRPPQSDEELHALIKAMWGIDLPRKQVCPDHCSPFDAVAHAFFGREPNYAVWYASRGSGKSLALAVLGMTKLFISDIDVTILGGSMTQSLNVAEHMKQLLLAKNAPRHALGKAPTVTQITSSTGHWVRPLPASQTTVRGPHPPLSLLDEVDEMEYPIYEAAMGQAMAKLNSRGELIQEYIVASSTWQNPDGTFTKVMEQARERGMPIMTWCWRELLEPHGWMTQRFIEQKRKAVSAEMFRTEYDLNEPSAASRAFDLDKIEEYFIDYPEPHDRIDDGKDDQMWEWEGRLRGAQYAVGADWAKEQDYTVLSVVRYDILPRRLVYLRRLRRRPYPEMISIFDKLVSRYGAVAAHDKTGLGNVVHDFSTATDYDTVEGFSFTDRRKRSQMLLGYISDFEGGGYRLPRNVLPFYRAHRSATTEDVYGSHRWDAHLPDDVASMALAHRAAGRIPVLNDIPLIPVDPRPRAATAGFAAKPSVGVDQEQERPVATLEVPDAPDPLSFDYWLGRNTSNPF